MKDLSKSIVRTVVPYLVGAVVTLAASKGFHLSEEVQANLDGLLTFVVGTLYYMVIRKAEETFPRLGWLLGTPTAPTYHH